jgi:hypothetical protein
MNNRQVKIDRGRLAAPVKKSDEYPLPYGWAKKDKRVTKKQIRTVKEMIKDADMSFGNRDNEYKRIGSVVNLSVSVIRKIEIGDYED